MVRSLLNICKILRSEGLVKMNSINKWKYLSFILMGIIAIPVITAISAPHAFAVATNSVLGIVQNIQDTLLPAIQTTDNAIKAKTDNLPSDPASNTQVNTRATQTSVDNLQTTANAIKAKTDNLPDGITEAQFNTLKCNAPVRAQVDLSGCNLLGADFSGASFIGADLSGANLDSADLSVAILSLADLSGANLFSADLSGSILFNADLSGANLQDTNFQGAILIGITSTGCTGTPFGTPAAGSLPVC